MPMPDTLRAHVPRTLMLAVCSFGKDLPAERVASAIAKGVRAAGIGEPDLCSIEDTLPADFDARMRSARALILAAERLEEQTLAGSPIFELATRARQAGVPAYAVTAENALTPFDARILDLQLILEARDRRELTAAGRTLGALS